MQFLQRHSNPKDLKAGTGEYSLSNPVYRKSYEETMERVSKMDPRQLAPQRRVMLKVLRYQGNKPELIAKAAAIRAAMSREINR